MSEYGKYTTRKPNALHSLLSHDSVKEAKAARKKLLEQIEQRRAANYKRLMEKKRSLQAEGDLI
jgi:hypothetical protein